MISRDTTVLLQHLNPHCASALEAAASLCRMRLADEITVEHWLLKLLEAGDGDIPAILAHYGIGIDAIWDALVSSIDHLPRNLRGKPALSPQLAAVLADAWTHSRSQDTQWPIRSANLLQAVVDAPHVLRVRDAWPLLSIGSAQIARFMPRLGARTCEHLSTLAGADDAMSANAGDAFSPAAHPSQTNGEPAAPAGAGKRFPSTPAADNAQRADALARYAIDLTEKAMGGEIDPVFGRDREIQQMVDVLARRRKNNPILVGEPGVGKTALVEGLALRVVQGDVPEAIRNVRVLTLDLGLLQAGAGVKGEFEQRLKTLIDAVQASDVPVLLFIDEAHTLVGAGNAAGGADAANLLKPALARGELRTIAATTWAEYKEFFERDAALERRFQMIKVEEPDDAAACLMLRGLKARYASYHQVHIRDEAIVAAVNLSRRYIPSRQLPDKAVDLIDTAAARVRVGLESPPSELQHAAATVNALKIELAALEADVAKGASRGDDGVTRLAELAASVAAANAASEVFAARYARERDLVRAVREQSDLPPETRDAVAFRAAREALADAQGKHPLIYADVDAQAVARVVSEWTGVPAGNLLEDELRGLLAMQSGLSERVVAQEDALNALAESLRIAKAGLKPESAPMGVFLLAGPSGVGKTETALALADLLFGGEAALTTINMSEYQEAHTVSQLKGAPPGYVGYGRGGVLTEAVRQRPYSVVLLDEVEKAHRDVLDMFYQVFDRGMMRDGEGREIDFRHCVILMTSNLGSSTIDTVTADTPDIAHAALLEAVRPELVAHFQPALLARFQTLIYRPLDVSALHSIATMKLGKTAARLRRQHGIELTWNDALAGLMAQRCLVRESGARNVDAFINQRILPALSHELLTRLAAGDKPASIVLTASEDGQLDIDFAAAVDPNALPAGTASQTPSTCLITE
ncbi:type VI secretion system ATPase TssH [Pandoraea norimbergensis]|uniref:ClpV1 family T6SS ATPase n=1 Tax=Pandoraea norimbergensis TaxID=93219 RepID=A0ABN4JNJ6_9BURK|nr:type VI secretion system ATPase TssH [Pandoraea norimbergensis]ALS62886.1 ClpV1 family T6SS ATPase [Pandoraea norimbergensis]